MCEVYEFLSAAEVFCLLEEVCVAGIAKNYSIVGFFSLCRICNLQESLLPLSSWRGILISVRGAIFLLTAPQIQSDPCSA